jgi:hypothetical protein
MVRRLTYSVLRLCSDMLTLGSGMLTSAQVNAAVAHVCRLKRNQRKGNNPDPMGIGVKMNDEFYCWEAMMRR